MIQGKEKRARDDLDALFMIEPKIVTVTEA